MQRLLIFAVGIVLFLDLQKMLGLGSRVAVQLTLESPLKKQSWIFWFNLAKWWVGLLEDGGKIELYLGGTGGEWLERMDCGVWLERGDSTRVVQENQEEGGRWVRVEG